MPNYIQHLITSVSPGDVATMTSVTAATGSFTTLSANALEVDTATLSSLTSDAVNTTALTSATAEVTTLTATTGQFTHATADTAVLADLSTTTLTAATGSFQRITTKELWLSDPVWEDLRFPAQGINLPGAPADPSASTTNGLLYFSGTADNVVAGVAQSAHAQQYNSTFHPHIHLVFPTSASSNTRWKLEWDIANVNGNFTMTIPTAYNAATTYADSDTITVANPQNTKKHVIAGFAPIDLGSNTVSLVMVWRLSRLADSDAADNHTSPVVLLEFDVHYPIDALGSRDEYLK